MTMTMTNEQVYFLACAQVMGSISANVNLYPYDARARETVIKQQVDTAMQMVKQLARECWKEPIDLYASVMDKSKTSVTRPKASEHKGNVISREVPESDVELQFFGL